MKIDFREAGEKLAQSGGWKPVPKDNSRAAQIAFVVAVGIGIFVLTLTGQPAFPANLAGAVLVGGVAGLITYRSLAK